MRTYGKRLLRGATDKATRQAAESRDAVLWDVLLTERVCRCKIQGSSEFVIARFPQNWATIPEWAKPGQAVRIAHRGGIRGYIEVVGFGRAIPTPVSGNATPTPSTPDDAILAGCLLKAISQTPGMSVYVTTGVARFNGAEYAVPAVAMTAGSVFKMNIGLSMGDVAGVFSMSAPSAGQFRYDLFSLSPASKAGPIFPAAMYLLDTFWCAAGRRRLPQPISVRSGQCQCRHPLLQPLPTMALPGA